MTSCKFCNKFSHTNRSFLPEESDIILYETPNFVVTPTLGSLVEGWVLIISKPHYVSAGELGPTYFNELQDLINLVKMRLEDLNKQVFVFEHGPFSPSQTVGCGIDHLHVHIVPLDFNLYEKSKSFSPFIWKKAKSVSTSDYFVKGLSYLYIECPSGERYITTDLTISSQFFGRVIAKELGIEQSFDWKQNYGAENIERTLQVFSNKFELA